MTLNNPPNPQEQNIYVGWLGFNGRLETFTTYNGSLAHSNSIDEAAG